MGAPITANPHVMTKSMDLVMTFRPPIWSFQTSDLELQPPVAERSIQLRCMQTERDFFVANLLVRIHLIVEMISADRLCAAPWELEFPFPGSMISNFLVQMPPAWHLH